MLKRISNDDFRSLASRLSWFSVDDNEIDKYVELSNSVLETIDLVQDQSLSGRKTEPSESGRSCGNLATRDYDPLNAVIRWIDVFDDTTSGLLSGLRIAVKDSVSIAGVPLTVGSAVLRDFVPSADSVVTERLLNAGARISAVTNMDDFAFSGGGETSAYGPIANPHDHKCSAGGSSGGSAAILSYGGQSSVDGSIGTDQGGSIRVPAAWCGYLGLKPTHGLVPYTGIVGIDATFDHVGPMARDSHTLGRILLAIAGYDPRDPRQRGASFDLSLLEQALESTANDFTGLKIGVVDEGFSEETADHVEMSRAVYDTAKKFAGTGAIIERISVPEHAKAGGIAFAGFIEGMAALARGGGNGFHWFGRYDPDLALSLNNAFRSHGDLLSPQIKLAMILGEHLQRHYGGSIYATAQNQRPALRAVYDRALKQYDFLLMPTVAFPAFKIDPSQSLAQRALRGWSPLSNCTPFNMTGHPAITLPLASANDMPAGVMVIAKHFDDARLIDFAIRCERIFGWNVET